MTRYIERAQFVIGAPDAGKSSILRGIFADPRLGGKIPDKDKIAESYHLSRERRLHIMLSSPPEKGRTVQQWLDTIDRKTRRSGRWCIAGALQPTAAKRMPDAADSLAAFVKHFTPERTRAVFLSPDRHGADSALWTDGKLAAALVSRGIEVIAVDSRVKHSASWIVADFFDFT